VQRITIPPKSWFLVCDGAKALLFQNMGDNNALNLRLADMHLEPHPPSRELGAEQPGRVHESLGESRSSVRGTDWHEAAEIAFLHRVADEVEAMVGTRTIQRLILVAPPKALGVLRSHLSAPVKEVLEAEVARDLARLPAAEIERHLSVLCQLP
jgi:protein required for attachment to host cells